MLAYLHVWKKSTVISNLNNMFFSEQTTNAEIFKSLKGSPALTLDTYLLQMPLKIQV